MKLTKTGDCMFRRNGPLCVQSGGKKVVNMLSTIHEAIMVETGKHDALGEKIEKPEAVYYYCGRMGRVDLSDQLLHQLLLFISKEKYEMVKEITGSHVQFDDPKCIHSKQTLWM